MVSKSATTPYWIAFIGLGLLDLVVGHHSDRSSSVG
jgi:hypothetical protein